MKITASELLISFQVVCYREELGGILLYLVFGDEAIRRIALPGDRAADFCQGLEELYTKIDNPDSSALSESIEAYNLYKPQHEEILITFNESTVVKNCHFFSEESGIIVHLDFLDNSSIKFILSHPILGLLSEATSQAIRAINLKPMSKTHH